MPDPVTLSLMVLLLLVIGAVGGLLAGLLGVGGGIVLVPAFFYAFTALGFDSPALMQICLGTSLGTIIVTSARSLSAHAKKGAVDWGLLRAWAPGLAIGAALGVLAASRLSSGVLVGIFGALASLAALYMVAGRAEWRLAPAMPPRWPPLSLAPGIGFLSVLMGIGGGTFGVPVLTLFGLPIHRAIATASGFGMAIALPSVAGFLFLQVPEAGRPPFTIGAVNLPAFALAIAMSLQTAPYGARLAHRTDPARLRRIFGLFLLVVGLNMLRKTVF